KNQKKFLPNVVVFHSFLSPQHGPKSFTMFPATIAEGKSSLSCLPNVSYCTSAVLISITGIDNWIFSRRVGILVAVSIVIL
ncbi:MAG: hypothetical protein MUP16_07300, partial [Sedimentisphaerales bacterium]|nr:hypothetical protein [Sedimentisphaerales bacterium]